MMKQNFWTKMSKSMRAFFLIALSFLVVGLGTLGSVSSVGKSYEVAKDEEIIIHVSLPDNVPKDLTASQLYVKRIYLNAGTVYGKTGSTAEVRLARGTSATGSFGSTKTVTLPAVTETVEEGKEPVALRGALYNWTLIDLTAGTSSGTSGWRVSTYNYYRLTTNKANVRINEVVFVAETESGADGAVYLLKTEIDAASTLAAAQGEKQSDVLRRAGAVIDCQHIPSMAQSSFFRFTEEEVYTLMTIAEMRAGKSFIEGDVYHLDTVYNSFGNDLLVLSTLIFGVSPFGLRLLPFLASFGILLVGFFLIKRMTGSERAGLIFSVLYVLSSFFFVTGHLGTPLTIGLFFLVLSFNLCHKFYSDGIRHATFVSALPVLGSALFSALAICVNGALLIPVLGIVGLFVAGMIRQQKAKAYYLDKAVAEASAAEGEEAQESKKNVAAVLKEYSFKNRIAFVYGAILLIGTYLLMLLSALPMYFPYVKAFDTPAAPKMSIMLYLWKAFAGGFTATNTLSYSVNPWLYSLFQGTGELYAVTMTGYLVCGVAAIAGLFGLVYTAVRLIQNVKNKVEGKEAKNQNRTAVILLAGFVLFAICSFFGNSLLATAGVFFFLFALAGFAADGATELDGKIGAAFKIVKKVWLALLAVSFVLMLAVTFSIPLPAGFMDAIF